MHSHLWPKPFDYLQHAKPFLISLTIFLTLLLSSLFFVIYSRTDALIQQRIRQQAVDYVYLLNLTKLWNFNYGGVYVEKRPGVESNIYLRKQGINPDLKGTGGKTFTVRNHAIMASEMSRLSEEHDAITFRIVSLKPLDPDNTPDTYERDALRSFSKGATEAYAFDGISGKSARFRYLVPMYVDLSCLECHFNQGYTIGDVIGAISVSLPVESLLREQRKNKLLILIGGGVTTLFIVTVCYFLTWRLVVKLDEAQRTLKRQATTDELTGLRNRRRTMSRLDEEFQRACRLQDPLCLIIIDIDHFKRVNDSHGHLFGDVVLKHVAARMQDTVRKYDIIGRIGGEEFLVITPGTSIEDAVTLAERLREEVGSVPVTDRNVNVDVTVSAGIASLIEGEDSIETLLRRADTALYKAKREGRNRVAIL